MAFYIDLREAIQHNSSLNFCFAVLTHHYFLLIVFALTFSFPQVKNSNIGVLMLLPMAGKCTRIL